MAARFNPPPGWPPAPEGWTPPPGWAPDPSWPVPPPGWQLWIDDAAPVPGVPVPAAPGGPDVSRFASPDPGTQVLPAQTFQTLSSPPSDGAPAGFGAQPGSWQGKPAGPDGALPGGPPSGGKQWLIPVIIAVVALLAIFGVLLATGVIGGDDSKASSQSEKSAKPTPTKSAKPSDEPSDEASEPAPATDNGTRESPLSAGTDATVYDWTVSMGATNLDAWGEISTVAAEFYTPEAGQVYVMAPTTVLFNGEDRGNAFDLDWVFVSAAGKTFSERCGYAQLPDEFNRSQELYSGGSDSGNVCVTVPAADAATGVWRVSSYGDFAGTYEAYFALS